MSVFVGNLPFDANEDELVEILSRAGPIKRFRVGRDASGRSRGYAFCDYYDLDTGRSAVRNLQGFEFHGRVIRLDMSDGGAGGTSSGGHGSRDAGYGQRTGLPPGGAAVLGPGGAPRNVGIAVPMGTTSTDAISRTLAALPPGKLLDIMTDMKQLVKTAPDQARALLNSNPQLAYALFQAMLMMNIVDPAVLERMLASAAQPQQQQQQQQQQHHHHQQQPLPPQSATFAQQQQQSHVAPPPPPPPPQQAQAPGATPDQAALIQQVLALTPQQIVGLPPEQRAVILQIRQQAVGAGLVLM